MLLLTDNRDCTDVKPYQTYTRKTVDQILKKEKYFIRSCNEFVCVRFV